MKSDSNKSFARTRIDAFYSLSFGLAIWLGIKKKQGGNLKIHGQYTHEKY